jgi:hypothetical protein
MPGTILLESVGPKRLVAGNPAKLNNLPFFLSKMHQKSIKELAERILSEYCTWSNEYNKTSWIYKDSTLKINDKYRNVSVTIDVSGDIVLLTNPASRIESVYFNLADLSTDDSRDPVKLELEKFMRLYFGLIFL